MLSTTTKTRNLDVILPVLLPIPPSTRKITVVFAIREQYYCAADTPKHPQRKKNNKGNQNKKETYARRLRSSLLLSCLPTDNVFSIAWISTVITQKRKHTLPETRPKHIPCTYIKSIVWPSCSQRCLSLHSAVVWVPLRAAGEGGCFARNDCDAVGSTWCFARNVCVSMYSVKTIAYLRKVETAHNGT